MQPLFRYVGFATIILVWHFTELSYTTPLGPNDNHPPRSLQAPVASPSPPLPHRKRYSFYIPQPRCPKPPHSYGSLEDTRDTSLTASVLNRCIHCRCGFDYSILENPDHASCIAFQSVATVCADVGCRCGALGGFEFSDEYEEYRNSYFESYGNLDSTVPLWVEERQDMPLALLGFGRNSWDPEVQNYYKSRAARGWWQLDLKEQLKKIQADPDAKALGYDWDGIVRGKYYSMPDTFEDGNVKVKLEDVNSDGEYEMDDSVPMYSNGRD